jgi:hypothetical protein
MNSYADWNERMVTVPSLLLDEKNPRIPELGTMPTQRQIAAELLEHDSVFDLAKDITQHGYFPTEVLIGVDENGQQTVVEGNRRLAALKFLLSPELAPDIWVKKFRMLATRVTSENIRKVRVVFAASREAAAPLIINRHTQTGVERWKPAQQAKYLRTLMSPGMSLDEAAQFFGMSRSQLTDNLRMDTMYRVACNLDLPEEVRNVTRDPRAFNASTLERLVQSPLAMDFLGVTFDERGRVSGRMHEDEFKKAFGRMVTDIVRGRIDTRKLNSSKEINAYLNNFGVDKPNHKHKGTFTSGLLLGEADDPRPTRTNSPKKRNTIRGSQYLIPSSMKCGLRNPRIKEIFNELRRLKVAQYPNACAVLLRIFLELVVGEHLDRTGKIKPLLAAARQKNKGSDWYPTLRQMLNTVLRDQSVTLSPLARKALNKMTSHDDHPLSLDQMDQFVHNRYVAPSEKELRKFWAFLEPLLEQFLVEPAAPASSRPGA